MPVTKVEAPDGSIISVEHPESASQQDILAFAQQEYENKRFAEALPKPGMSGRFAEPIAPKQGGSIADPLGQGLSFGFSDEIAGALGASVNSSANLFGAGTGESFGDAYRGIRDAARYNQEAFSERNPGTALAAELAGGVLTGGAGAARAGAFNALRNANTVRQRLGQVAGVGAIQGGLYGAGTSEAEDVGGFATDTAQGAALGGALAPVLPAAASALRSGATAVFRPQTANRSFQKAVQLLKDKAGIDTLTTGQATGSRQLRATETTFGETLLGARLGGQIDKNRLKLQGSIMRLAGFTKKDSAEGLINTDSIERAGRLFTKRYSQLLRGKKINLDDNQFIDDLAIIESDHLSLIPPFQKRQVTEIIESLIDEALSGPMSAARYQKLRSRLSKLSNTGTDPNIKSLYRALKASVDDVFARQSGMGNARSGIDQAYSRYSKIRDTFNSSGGIDTSRGFMPLSSVLNKASKYDDKEFNALLRAGQSVLGDPVANSSTASRMANLMLLGEGSASAAVGGLDAGVLGFGIPIGLSQSLARGYTGNTVMNRLIDAGLLTAPVAGAVK